MRKAHCPCMQKHTVLLACVGSIPHHHNYSLDISSALMAAWRELGRSGSQTRGWHRWTSEREEGQKWEGSREEGVRWRLVEVAGPRMAVEGDWKTEHWETAAAERQME